MDCAVKLTWEAVQLIFFRRNKSGYLGSAGSRGPYLVVLLPKIVANFGNLDL